MLVFFVFYYIQRVYFEYGNGKLPLLFFSFFHTTLWVGAIIDPIICTLLSTHNIHIFIILIFWAEYERRLCYELNAMKNI